MTRLIGSERYDSEDDWPLLWPDYTQRAKRCSKCCHPSTYHILDVRRGKGLTMWSCADCSCIASREDFVDDGPLRGHAYAKG